MSFRVDVLEGPKLLPTPPARDWPEYLIVGRGERASKALILKLCHSEVPDPEECIDSGSGNDISDAGRSSLRFSAPGIRLLSRARSPVICDCGRLGMEELIARISFSLASSSAFLLADLSRDNLLSLIVRFGLRVGIFDAMLNFSG